MGNFLSTSLDRFLDKHKTDKDSEYYVPNDHRNRPSQDPERARVESPGYRFNAESVYLSSFLGERRNIDPAIIVEWYHDKLSQPNFNMRWVCRACEEWKPSRVVRPQRKGAAQPEESCYGCWFSHLDGDRSGFTTTEHDTVFDWWMKVRSLLIRLEVRRARAKRRHTKHLIDQRRQELFEELKRAKAACQRLGINPAAQARPETGGRGDSDPLPDPTANATCRTCSAWSYDEQLSAGKSVKKGYCWGQDGSPTPETYWCGDHKPG